MTSRGSLLLKRSLRTSWTLIAILAAAVSAPAFQNFEGEKLRIAAAQHEIIQILLKEQKFEAVFPELDKILNLRIAARYEEKVAHEVLIISSTFLSARRPDLAIRALDRGIQGVEQPGSKSQLYQELGYVHRLQGNDVKAMECFRQAKYYAEKLSTRPPH